MNKAIVIDPEIMHGEPVFRGTRVPVKTLFDYFEGGETLGDFLEGFPTVPRPLAVEALESARQLLLASAWCAFFSTNASMNDFGIPDRKFPLKRIRTNQNLR
jgi:uncharacterized protein (DUF433 family)